MSFPYFVDEEDPTPAPKPLGRGLTEYVLRSGEPLLATPAVFEELERRGEVESIGTPSLDWLGVPLKSGTACIGVLVVQTYDEKTRFGERDREILKFVSQQLAAAIEHKRYEEALRRSEARSRSLILSAAFGICRCTLGGRFLDVNPALITMLGHGSVEDLLRLDVRSEVFVHPQELDQLAEDYRRTGSLKGVEVQWKRKDGRVIIVRLSGSAASSSDEPEEVLELIAEDITDRRQLEEQLRQAQKMDAVGRLAGGVAHDFNNLLMVINGYTEVLLEQLEKGSAMHHKVQSIQQAADRAATLTRQLLAFSRKQLLELKVVDVNTVVGDMERLLRPLIGENIELVTRLSTETGHTRADAGQLEQVIMNLVVNAKDAMPEGGKLTLQTADVTVRAGLQRTPFYPARALCRDLGFRYRPRHGQGNPVPHLRALLYHQGKRKRHRPRPLHRLRHRQAEQWIRVRAKRAGSGHNFLRLFAARRRSRRRAEPGQVPATTKRAAAKPCCWWKTKNPCANWCV